MIQPINRTTYVPHIDGLRAAAVLSVIVYHLNAKWLPGGLAGVDVFFVISGFVVSASLAEFRKSTVPAFFAYFYARRMLRILPALVVCLTVVHLASMLFIPYAWLSDANQRTGFFAYFGLSNFILAENGGNYFAPRAEFNPYTHTWSLGVEEQFYLIFPPLFAAWIAGGQWRRASSILFAVGLIASLGCAAWLGARDRDLAFYMLYSRFWELAVGVLLYQGLVLSGHAFAETHRPATRLSRAGAIASTLLIAGGFAFARPLNFPFPDALWAVVGTAGVLAFLHGREPRGLVMRLLRLRAVVFVGQISYSLYLWHWPVFVLFRWTYGLDTPLARVVATAITFALAIGSYYFVERPPRRMIRLHVVPRWAIISAGVIVVLACVRISQHIDLWAPQWSFTTVARHVPDWYPGPLDDIGPRNCTFQFKVDPLGTSTVTTWSGVACRATSTPPMHVFVIGDSHALAYATMLPIFAMDTGSEVRLYANGGCPFVSFQRAREYCQANAAAAVADVLQRARNGDVLFLPSLRLERLTDQNVRRDEALARQNMLGPAAVAQRKVAVDDATTVLQSFAERGVHIVFAAPGPILRAPPFRCVDWFNRDNPICAGGLTIDRAEMLRYREPVMQAFAAVSARVAGVSVWDPFPTLCPEATCNAMRDGHPLFYDGDHLSGYANRLLLPDFEKTMARLSGEPIAAPRSLDDRRG